VEQQRPAGKCRNQTTSRIAKRISILLNEKTANLNHLAINTEHNEVIELVANANEPLDVQKLKNILLQNKMDTAAIYQWQNHYVIFDTIKDVIAVR